MTSSFKTVTGCTLEEFGRLFAMLLPRMRTTWPRCPPTCEPDERPKQGELRFKLFLALHRLRRYSSYSAMEVTFGWSASGINLWCDTMFALMDEDLAPWRRFPTATEQMDICWQFQKDTHDRHRERKVSSDEPSIWELYQRRWQTWVNEVDVSPELRQRLIAAGFKGVIGSGDGTYALGWFTAAREQEFWTGFKRLHGWKLLIYVSHFKKYILHIQIAPAPAGDASVHIDSCVSQALAPGVYMFGDHAFHNVPGVVPGYSQAVIAHVAATDSKLAAQMKYLCSDHSHYRIVTEKANRKMKLWGVVRGRSDCRMHCDRLHGHGTDSFAREVRVVWSLENMRATGFFDDTTPPLISYW